MIDLILCAVCKRHIRPEEVCCPFCDTAVPAPERRPKFAPIPVGLSRSRLYALHAAAFATGVGSIDRFARKLGPRCSNRSATGVVPPGPLGAA